MDCSGLGQSGECMQGMPSERVREREGVQGVRNGAKKTQRENYLVMKMREKKEEEEGVALLNI